METYTSIFKSIGSFYDYITTTEYNYAFSNNKDRSSVNGSKSFTQTGSFEEAVSLLKNGWSEMANTIQTKLRIQPSFKEKMQFRNAIDVAGFQPIVPLYLSNVPANMVSKRIRPVKQKVVEITKLFNYSGIVNTETIVNQSVLVLHIVEKLESQGLRVNLNIALGTQQSVRLLCKVRIKNANEKLNISKMAFPLVHPSMLRRLFFRFIEVEPHVTSKFVNNYGFPTPYNEMCRLLKDDIVLPSIFNGNVEDIKTLDDLKASF